MPKETSAGVIVYYKEHNTHLYLLLHYQAGHWDLPKGHVEPGEKLRETALRETKEETNLDVKLNDKFEESLSYFYKNKDGLLMNKTVHFFIGESKTKDVKISFEHNGYNWLDFEKALQRLTYDNAKEILKKANEFLAQKTLEDY